MESTKKNLTLFKLPESNLPESNPSKPDLPNLKDLCSHLVTFVTNKENSNFKDYISQNDENLFNAWEKSNFDIHKYTLSDWIISIFKKDKINKKEDKKIEYLVTWLIENGAKIFLDDLSAIVMKISIKAESMATIASELIEDIQDREFRKDIDEASERLYKLQQVAESFLPIFELLINQSKLNNSFSSENLEKFQSLAYSIAKRASRLADIGLRLTDALYDSDWSESEIDDLSDGTDTNLAELKELDEKVDKLCSELQEETKILDLKRENCLIKNTYVAQLLFNLQTMALYEESMASNEEQTHTKFG